MILSGIHRLLRVFELQMNLREREISAATALIVIGKLRAVASGYSQVFAVGCTLDSTGFTTDAGGLVSLKPGLSGV